LPPKKRLGAVKRRGALRSRSNGIPGPKGEAIIKRTSRVISPSIARDLPLVVESAHGSIVTDVDGNRFIDFSSGIAVLSTGSTHPKVVEAAKRQLDRFLHFSYTDFYYENLVTLAEKLCELVPGGGGEKKVYWGNSGAEAIEAAMKLARNYTGRPIFLAHSGAFHGRTMGALSLTASKPIQRKGASPLVPAVVHFPFPYCYRCPWNQTFPGCDYYCIDFFKEEYLEKFVPVDDVAAYFFEPFQGEGGYIIPPPEYFKRMEFLRKEGVLLVADEVQTGIGRSGRFFAFEHFGIEPDIVAVAKGIASGLPLGGIVSSTEIMDSWVPGQHASTFGANPVAVEAALATLEVINSEKLIENAVKMGRIAMKRLEEMKERYEIVGDVRGKGLFIGVELVKNKKTKERGRSECQDVMRASFKEGLVLISAGQNTLRVIPPLNVARDELEEGLDVMEGAIAQVNSHRGSG
jgi:4-aminobutyrate aminotransferase